MTWAAFRYSGAIGDEFNRDDFNVVVLMSDRTLVDSQREQCRRRLALSGMHT